LTEDSFAPDGWGVITETFSNAHQKTIQKIKEHGKPIIQIEKFLNSRIKDDPILVKQLLRVCFSAYTNNPINLGVLAPTSEGKTYATVQVTNLFPIKDVIAVARLSPTALIHQNGVLVDENGEEVGERLDQLFFEILQARKDKNKELSQELESKERELKKNTKNLVDLSNKILLFLDNPNPNTYEMLKPLLSHDKYELLYKTTTSDGALKVKETIIRGWPATIICSAKNEAKNEVWPEISSRFFMTSPNSNVGKYKSANQLTADVMGIPSWAGSIRMEKEEKKYCQFFIEKIKDGIIKLCKDGINPIFNPYRQNIVESFPNTQGIDMRHFSRFNAFCNIETILNANSNVKIEFMSNEDNRYVSIITSLQNIDDTTKILGEISVLPPDKIKFFDKVFKNCILESMDTYGHDEDYVSLTSKELAEKYTRIFKKPITAKKIIENYLEPLVDEGLLESKPNPDNKSQNYYSLGSSITIHDLSKLKSILGVDLAQSTPIDTVDKGHLYIWLGVAKLGQVSTKYGKLVRLFDKNGTLNFIDFQKTPL